MIMGAIIKMRRESLGLSQKDFAAMLGVSPGSVWNWENGESNPKIELILPVANALDVDPNFLFGVSEFDSLEADPEERVKALHDKFGEPNKKTPSMEFPSRENAFKHMDKLSDSDLLLVQKIIDSIIEVRQDCPE